MKIIKNKSIYLVALLVLFLINSCEVLDKFEPLGENSIADKTPPAAKFTFTQGEGTPEAWKEYSFSNQSMSSIGYAWDFGDGNTSTEVEPQNIYSGEGVFIVSLTAKDNLGVENTFSQEVTVVEPAASAVADPILINSDFTKQAKSSGSDCTCSGWINRSTGAQGESTSGNGGSNNILKFDNDENDAAYQEFAVQPNADYTMKIVVSFDALSGGSFPSIFELRVLAGSGYFSGYTPAYYAEGIDFPQDDFGYTSISQVEDAGNNLLLRTINHPNDTSYITYDYTFNAGANTSVALFMRGIGGDGTPSDDKGFLYNNGDEEIQIDSVIIEAQ